MGLALGRILGMSAALGYGVSVASLLWFRAFRRDSLGSALACSWTTSRLRLAVSRRTPSSLNSTSRSVTAVSTSTLVERRRSSVTSP